MKLLKLTLTNFKGIRNFTLDTQGGNAIVSGDNATGKTTLFDSVLWLLFGKDSQNKKDFDIKTLDGNNKPIPGLDHEVEGTFSDINGRQLTLKKSYKEKYTRKRGTSVTEFTGHTTDHYIDGVPVPEKDYLAKIAEIAREDIFKLLTNPAYFNEQLKWTERRKILLEVCGDISDEDVIASNEPLSKLPEILHGRKLDDHKKVIAARRTEINEELKKLPVRIDEATKGLPDINGIDPGEYTGKITVLKARVKEKNAEISRIQGGGEVAEKTKSLREVEGRILDLKNQHRTEADKRVQGKRTELNKLKDQIAAMQQEVKSHIWTINGNKNIINASETKAAKLREEWHEVNGQQFTFEQTTTCPTCGQPLPEEGLAEAKEKAMADFNRTKAQKLEEISKEGRRYKADIEKLQAENEALEIKVSDMGVKIDTSILNEEALKVEMEALAKEGGDITENPAYAQTLKEKDELENQIRELASGNAGQVTGVKAEVALLENEIAFCEKALAQVDQYNKGQKRIEELKEQEKKLAAEFEKLEGELYLTEEFIRAKVAMLEEKINSKFKMARFKLFDVQVNGGVAECCETLFNGVPYSSGLNNAARINVGLDIINTLSEHYDFVAPVFIDNAEAVTKLIETKGQLISLVVSEQDKKLRVEIENTMREAV